MPPLEGVFLDNTIWVYDGQAKADRQFVVGGNVVTVWTQEGAVRAGRWPERPIH